jgi:hypothetical protein
LAVKETGAERVIATHGYTEVFSQYLRSVGYDATAESTEFGAEDGTDQRTDIVESSVDPLGLPGPTGGGGDEKGDMKGGR